MIFDEADRMLDLGFEREMNKCLKLIKEKAADKFLKPAATEGQKDGEATGETYWSDSIKVNFVSATMNHQVEALGNKLMQSYVKVGFSAS